MWKWNKMWWGKKVRCRRKFPFLSNKWMSSMNSRNCSTVSSSWYVYLIRFRLPFITTVTIIISISTTITTIITATIKSQTCYSVLSLLVKWFGCKIISTVSFNDCVSSTGNFSFQSSTNSILTSFIQKLFQFCTAADSQPTYHQRAPQATVAKIFRRLILCCWCYRKQNS